MTNNENDKQSKFKHPKELLLLSKLFEENGIELYIVGDYVRDWFLDIQQEYTDIDICSTATPEQLTSILKDTVFKYELVSKKFGVFKITTKNCDICFKHSTFKKETYNYGTKPNKVEFVQDIVEDAKSRDFTVNCIYYNIPKKQFYDPLNGISDCQNNVLKMVDPHTFDFDALRILRMVGLALNKWLGIDEATFKKAKMQSYRLRDIPHERIAKEIRQIFVCLRTTFPKFEDSRIEFLKALVDLDVFQYIFPELNKYIALPLLNKNAIYPNNIEAFCRYDLIMALIYFLGYNVENISKQECMPEFYFDMLSSKGLMLPRNAVLTYRVIVDGLLTLDKMYDKSNYVSYVQLYFPFLPQIVEARSMLFIGKKDEKLHRLTTTERLMVANHIPRHLGELSLNTNDIVKNFANIDKNQISLLLEFAFFTATRFRNNDKDFLIKKIKEHLEKKENEN